MPTTELIKHESSEIDIHGWPKWISPTLFLAHVDNIDIDEFFLQKCTVEKIRMYYLPRGRPAQGRHVIKEK